jgi:hypothetical protein
VHRSRTLAVTLLLGIGSASSAAAAAAEDWPKWLGPRGDNISKQELSEKWPADGPKRVWSADVGEGYASPVARGGKVYLFAMKGGDQETLTCFDAASGQVDWSQGYNVRRKPDYEGTRATPAIDGERIYTLGQSGDLVCRELADGKEVWRTNVLDETKTRLLQWGCASSPLVVGDRVFVQTGSGGPIAVAVNKDTGKIDWRSEAKSLAGYASLVHAEVKGKPQLLIFAGRRVRRAGPGDGQDDLERRVRDAVRRQRRHAGLPRRAGAVHRRVRHGPGGHVRGDPDVGEEAVGEQDLKSRFQPVVLDDGFVYGNDGGTLVA